MTDANDDWFEEAKKYFVDLNHTFSTRHFSRKLIQEVERLQKELADAKSTIQKQGEMLCDREGNMGGLVQKLRERLRKAEKERDELKQKLSLAHNKSRIELMAEIDELKAENLQQSKDWDELDDEYSKLKAEKDRLKWYKAITDADWETLKKYTKAVARGDL